MRSTIPISMLASLKSQDLPLPEAVLPDLISGYPLPTWVISAKTLKVIFANKAATELFGHLNDEVSGNGFLDLFAEKSRVHFAHQVTASQKNFSFSCILQRKKENVTVELHAASLLIHEQLHYQVTAVEITKRIILQEQLEEQSIRYRTYIKQSFEGIYCQEMRTPIPIHLSPEEIIERARDSYLSECNDAMAKMYGFTNAGELSGVMVEQLMDFSDPANLEYFKLFISNGFKVINAESHEKDRNGNPRYFLNNIIGIVEEGHLIRIWGTQKDITEQKKTENELRLLANLVEQTSDVLTAADMDYRPMTWNKAAEKVYGLKYEEAIGKDISKLIRFTYSNTTREVIRHTIKQEGEWRGEASFTRPTDQKHVTLLIGF